MNAFIRGAQLRREEDKETILVFLESGPKFTEEIRFHLAYEMARTRLILREMLTAGLIQGSAMHKANGGKRWRLAPKK